MDDLMDDESWIRNGELSVIHPPKVQCEKHGESPAWSIRSHDDNGKVSIEYNNICAHCMVTKVGEFLSDCVRPPIH